MTAPVADSAASGARKTGVGPRGRILRALWFFAVWIMLGRTGPADLIAGAMASMLAAEFSLRIIPPSTLHPRAGALAAFAGHFVRRSLAAGVDVARRVLDPALPIAPGLLTMDCDLPKGLRRQAFAATISLQPGTVPLGGSDHALLLHALDLGSPVREELDADLAVFLAAIGAAPASVEKSVV